MSPLNRLALLALVAAFCAPTPALASSNGDHRATARVAVDATDSDPLDDYDEADSDAVPFEASASNPFCLEDEDPDGLDEVDSVIEEDPADAEGDILDEDVADEPVDLDAILDFCDDGPTGDDAAVGSLKRALRGLSIPTDTMNISVPGTITRTLRLSKTGLPKALRPYANTTLGSARQVAPSDGFLDLPVLLNKQGRKALRGAKRDVKLVLTSTETLASGQSRARTQNIVLER